MRTTLKTSDANTTMAPPLETKRRAPAPATPPARAEIRTVLVAECGWPTDATQPSRKQPAKRR